MAEIPKETELELALKEIERVAKFNKKLFKENMAMRRLLKKLNVVPEVAD